MRGWYNGMAVVVLSFLLIGGAILGQSYLQGPKQGESYARPIFTPDSPREPRIRPGPPVSRDGIGGATSLSAHNPYQGDPHAIGEGYHLYRWMNCIGCHGSGGGSIGPTLWDSSWIYGGAPAEIAESILRGRPNGMPAFGDRLTDEQVWKLVAYIQDLRPGGGVDRAGDK